MKKPGMHSAKASAQGSTSEVIQQNLKDLVRTSSVSRLSTYGQNQPIEITEITSPFPVMGHWMVMVLISGPAVKITIKIHFMHSDVQVISSMLLGKKAEEVTISETTDFVQELCNMTGGNIKSRLEAQNLSAGMSLPLLTRGFDEVFFRHLKGDQKKSDRWALNIFGVKLSYSSVIEIKDESLLSAIQFDSQPNVEGGDVEFL